MLPSSPVLMRSFVLIVLVTVGAAFPSSDGRGDCEPNVTKHYQRFVDKRVR